MCPAAGVLLKKASCGGGVLNVYFFYFLLSLVAGLLDGQEVEVCVFFFFSIKLLLGVYVAVSLWEENVFRSLTWLQEVTNRTPRPNLQVAIQQLVCGSLSY